MNLCARKTLTRDLYRLQPPHRINPIILHSLLLQLLLLSLHYIRQTRISWLIQPQVRRDDHRQLRPQRLHPAIHLPRDRHLLALELYLGRRSRLRPIQQPGQHLPRLARIVVDRLLPQDHQIPILLLHHGLQQLRHAQRLQIAVLFRVDLDQDTPIGTHRHGRPQHVLRFRHPGRDGEDVFDGDLPFADPDRLFDGELVEGVHRVFDALRLDCRLRFVDARLDLMVKSISYSGRLRQDVGDVELEGSDVSGGVILTA